MIKFAKAAEINEESRQLKLILTKQKDEDAQRKIDLIQEIKTIQTLSSRKIKNYDPTESSGLGLLCEMSLTEVHLILICVSWKINFTHLCEKLDFLRYS